MKHSSLLIGGIFCFSSATASEGFKLSEITGSLEGRLLADAACYHNSHDAQDIKLNDGSLIRSLRIGINGSLCSICNYQIEVDYNNRNIKAKNIVLRTQPLPNWQFDIGHFKSYFSLEEMTSTLSTTFIERSLINTFVPKRNYGVGVRYFFQYCHNTDYSFAIGGFGDSSDSNKIFNTNKGYNFTSRLVGIYSFTNRSYSMVGLNLNYLRSPKNNILQYNPKPESNVSDTSLVDTGFINSTQSSYLYGFETALQFGKLGFQSEYMINKLDRADHKDLKFHGFYLYASYFLTEDYRPLNKSLAEFEKIKPTSYRGALELAFRFSYIDLDDKDIYGGHERNVTLGMNWYLNKNIRFMSNIIHANANKRGIKTSPMIYALRAQVDFD